MSMDQPRRPTRTPGGPMARSPRAASPAIAVVVALVAAVLGFVILKSLDDDDASVSTGGDSTEQPDEASAQTTIDPALTTAATTTTTISKTAFKVLVANASQVAKSAAGLSDQMAALGYQMLAPTNALDTTTVLATTVVYYYPGAEAAGADVANALGKAAAVMPTPLPVTDASLDGASVLVMLGTDLAGQTIPGAAAVTGNSAAPAAAVSPNDSTATSG